LLARVGWLVVSQRGNPVRVQVGGHYSERSEFCMGGKGMWNYGHDYDSMAKGKNENY